MNTISLLIAMSTVSIDFGWDYNPGGGINYIVQIEPKQLESIREGTVFDSDLPEVPGGIRRHQIVIGTNRLPHQGEPLPQMTSSPSAPSSGLTTPADPRYSNMAPPATSSPMQPPPAATSSLGPTLAPPASLPPSFTNSPPAATNSPTPAATSPTPAPTAPPSQFTEPFTPSRTFAPNRSDSSLNNQPAANNPAPASNPPPISSSQPMVTPKPTIDSTTAAELEKPWMPLMVTLMGLFASLGGNVFLGMVTWSQRVRFSELVTRLRSPERRPA
jgi:hypothetical protein